MSKIDKNLHIIYNTVFKPKKEGKMDEKQLELIFGKESTGATPKERAMTSKRLWVRSDAQLSIKEFPNSPAVNATGLYMSSLEALQVFGIEMLWEAIDQWEGNAIILRYELSTHIRTLIEKSDLSFEQIIQKSRSVLSEQDIKNAMDKTTQTPMKVLCELAPILDFDPRKIGVFPLKQVQPYPFK